MYDNKNDAQDYSSSSDSGLITTAYGFNRYSSRYYYPINDFCESTRLITGNRNTATGSNLVKQIVNHKGNILWDNSKPDGTPRKLMEVSRLTKNGWNSRIILKEGILEQKTL